MNGTLSLLGLFGITPATYPFLILAILIVGGIGYIRVSLGNPLGKMKENILVIVTHLASSRSKLNPSLIKQMSPLQIQPEGQKILEESGFIDIFRNNKTRFFKNIEIKKPRTKLEVEDNSIYSFLEVMSDDGVLNPIKTYLYQHPDVRETFPTLAGVYIRDRYLNEHLDITE